METSGKMIGYEDKTRQSKDIRVKTKTWKYTSNLVKENLKDRGGRGWDLMQQRRGKRLYVTEEILQKYCHHGNEGSNRKQQYFTGMCAKMNYDSSIIATFLSKSAIEIIIRFTKVWSVVHWTALSPAMCFPVSCRFLHLCWQPANWKWNMSNNPVIVQKGSLFTGAC